MEWGEEWVGRGRDRGRETLRGDTAGHV
jgi:hypothetical protein